MGSFSKALRKTAIALIQCYRVGISPFLGERCRFYPSCSKYAITAIDVHGFVKGLLLAFKRILRCQPLCSGGYDPVPEASKQQANQ